MSTYKKYIKKEIFEIRPVVEADILNYKENGAIMIVNSKKNIVTVSIDGHDKRNGSPVIGDVICRDPKNYFSQWLISEKEFKTDFSAINEGNIHIL